MNGISNFSDAGLQAELARREEAKKPKGYVIKSINGAVLFESTKTTVREAVEEAVKKKVSLRFANLTDAKIYIGGRFAKFD